MANPRNFLLNTNYELDKIILVKSGDFTGSVEIPHNLGFAPLPFGVWSTTPDFTTVNSLGVVDTGNDTGYTRRLGVSCTSFDDKIKLVASGGGSDSTKIYYRLYAFESPTTNHDVDYTSNLANTFILNTDYNYRKLMTTGTFDSDYQEYAHNLGYIPQVMAWSDDSASNPNWGIEPLMFASNFTDYKITVTTTKIQVGSIGNNEKIYWRIYYDEA